MANPQPDANAKRHGLISAEDAIAQAQNLEELAAQMRGYAVELAAMKKPLKVDGITKIERGIGLVADFVGNISRAMLKAKFK